MPITDPCFDAQMERLLAAFFPGRPQDAFVVTSDEYARHVQALSWADDALFEAAVDRCELEYDRMPSIKQVVAACNWARDERDRAVLFLPKPRERRIDELSQEERDALRAVMHRARAEDEAKRAQEAGR